MYKLSDYHILAFLGTIIAQAVTPLIPNLHFSDFAAGFLGQAVFTVSVIIIGLEEKQNKPSNYVLLLLKVFGAAITTAAIMSILRSGGFWILKADVSDPNRAYVIAVLIGAIYSLLLNKDVRGILFDKFKDRIAKWGSGNK